MNDFLPYLVVLTWGTSNMIMLIFVCILSYYICIFGKKLLRACVYCYSKTEFK
jgi:hypothetical protein